MVEEEEGARERQLAELEFIQPAYAIEEARVTENSINGRLSVVRLLTLPVNLASNENPHHFVTIELNLEMPPILPGQKRINSPRHRIVDFFPGESDLHLESCSKFAPVFSGQLPRSSDGIFRRPRWWRGSVACTDSRR
jgi:hypothetical protein